MNLNFFRHFATITKHHCMVMKYCMRAGLIRQGLVHDFSKYSPEEFMVGVKYYQGYRSPNNAEREALGLSNAWLHHKGRNKHHFEYWIDYSTDSNNERVLTGMPMPRKYIAEMIFDRVSASRVYRGKAFKLSDPLAYYNASKYKMWFIHPDTKHDMEMLLTMWAEKGEDYTVNYIKNAYLKHKDEY